MEVAVGSVIAPAYAVCTAARSPHLDDIGGSPRGYMVGVSGRSDRRHPMIGRRRPLARAAMVGGAGYMAGKHAANNRAREDEQEARIQELEAQQMQQQAAAAPPPPPPPPAAAPPPPAPAAAPAGDDLVAKINQ